MKFCFTYSVNSHLDMTADVSHVKPLVKNTIRQLSLQAIIQFLLVITEISLDEPTSEEQF